MARRVKTSFLSAKNKDRILEVLASGQATTLIGAARAIGLKSSGALAQERKVDSDWGTQLTDLIAESKVRDLAIKGSDEEFPDFLEWRERFCGYYLPDETVVRAKNYWFHDEAYQAIMENDRLLVLFPPLSLKTSIWSMEFSTYLIMKSRRTRITVLQKSQPESRKIVRAVKQRLTDHEFYQGLGIPRYADPISLYGGKYGFQPDKYGGEGLWNQDAFTVRDTGWGEKDPTMQSKGWESTILSNRADYIIMDDVQDPHGYTADSSRQIVDELQLQVNTRLGPESKLVILGSRLGPNDIYEEIMGREAFDDWPVIKFPAAFSKGTRIAWDPSEGEGDPLVPDVWPWPKLMKKRKEVGAAWHSAYMQEEGDRPDAVFTREKLEAARNYELLIGQVPEPVTHIYIGMDPAIVNWNVIIVWGLDKSTGIRYLIDVVRQRGLGNWDNAIALLSEAADRYMPRAVVIEVNNTQGHVADTARTELGAKGHIIVEYKTSTGSGSRHEDQDYSISSIGALFDGDLVQLPYGDHRSREIVDSWIDEFARWHTAEDGTSIKNLVRDQVMATLFPESEARLEMHRVDQAFASPRSRRFATNKEGGWRWSKTPSMS